MNAELTRWTGPEGLPRFDLIAEDAAALIGLVIAFLAMFLHQITGIAAFDAIGSILVGVLLVIVAIVLIDRNRRYLVGENVNPHIQIGRAHV